MYASRGVKTYLICATRGEVGDVDPDLMAGYRSVGELREAELRCAASKLGLAGVYFLNYRDSGMPGSPDNQNPRALVAQPMDQVVAQVVRLMREIRPQVVITFDPIGGYRHPDHIYIHQATVKAFEVAGNPKEYPDGQQPYSPQRLYFNTISRSFLKWAVRILPIFGQDPHRFGRNKDIDLVSLAGIEYPVHVLVDYQPVAEARKAAARCHESQGGVAMTKGIQGMVMRFMRGRETFMQAEPAWNMDGHKEHDLFYGVDSSR